MQIIICTDSDGGILFNHRRVSRDIAVLRDICSLTRGRIVYVHPRTYHMIDLHKDDLDVADLAAKMKVGKIQTIMKKRSNRIVYFAEQAIPAANLKNAKEIIVYNWNTKYPADVYLDKEILKGYVPVSEIEFAGRSHPKIIRTIYKRLETPA